MTVGLVMLLGFLAYDTTLADRRTATADVTVNEFRDTPGRTNEITFSYVVNGHRYRKTIPISNTYRPGEQLRACFNPANPEDVGLKWGDDECGQSLLP